MKYLQQANTQQKPPSHYRFLSKDDDRWEKQSEIKVMDQRRDTYAKYYDGKVKNIFS